MDAASAPVPERSARAPQRRLPASKRRALILEAALAAFAAHGYDGASMDEIAAAAGVSKAVVYDHVASKRDLYMELLEAIRSELVSVVETALEEDGTSGETRVRVAVEAFFRYVEEHPQACRLLFLEVEGPAVSALGRELEERIATRMAATLGAAPQLFAGHRQRDRQLYILAELLKSALQGLASWWYAHPELPREDLVERSVALVWPALVRAAEPDA